MRPIEFPQQSIILAKDQPQYQPLPVYYDAGNPEGLMLSCWKPSLWERIKILFGEPIWCGQQTFHQPLQPQSLTIGDPFREDSDSV